MARCKPVKPIKASIRDIQPPRLVRQRFDLTDPVGPEGEDTYICGLRKKGAFTMTVDFSEKPSLLEEVTLELKPRIARHIHKALRRALSMPKVKKEKKATFRGQGNTCRGELTIVLRGPQGSGKSLVERLLRALLPLTPVAGVRIVKEQTEA